MDQRTSSIEKTAFALRWLFLGAVMLLAVLLSGCAGSGQNKNVRANRGPQIVPVSVATAQQRDMPVYLTGLGSVTAYNTVSVKSRVDGQLVEVNFKEGQHVNKGELLALIDPRPYEVALNQAQATLFRDQAQLRDARLNYERFKGLLQDSGAMSQQQVDTQRATADQLEGAVRADQAAISSAKLNLTYCHITSPIGGRVGIRLVDVGNMVHASDANPLLVITQLEPIAVLFTLPEDQLPSVSQHMRRATLEVDAYSRDDQTKLASGTLLTIDNQIDQTTGTGRLKAIFTNKEGSLWPNQFVNIRLLLEVRKNSTVVPTAAIQRGPQGTFVYAMKADKTVDVHPVTVAFAEGDLSVLSAGTAPGDVVVTDGQDKLQAGAKVEPRNPASPGRSPGNGPNGNAGQSAQAMSQ